MKKGKKPQPKTKCKLPSESNKLDWNEFNFLENLLVFCITEKRDVPPENGLHFHITPRDADKSLCILFEIDRRGDSLFTDGKRKPDFMVLYANNELCLCTIIELKGGKDTKDSIEQIKNLRDKLNREIREHLPKRFQVKFQAIILHSPNNQTPNRLIADESTDEFVIRPVQVTQKAELFDLVSQKFTFTKPNINPQEQIRSKRVDLFTETVLMNHSLPKRIIDKFCKSNKTIANNRDGIYINHYIPKENYSALAIDTNYMKIGLKSTEKQIEKDLNYIGLKTPKHFEIVEIES